MAGVVGAGGVELRGGGVRRLFLAKPAGAPRFPAAGSVQVWRDGFHGYQGGRVGREGEGEREREACSRESARVSGRARYQRLPLKK